VLPPDVPPDIDIAVEAPEGRAIPDAARLDEAPPPPPRHKGVVLESSLGALGFAGQFRHIAPPAAWLHTLLGYEATGWLMFFGEAELAYTDTSEAAGPTEVRAFPILGFGGGARVTMHASERVAVYAQLAVDALAADVPHGALAVLGYKSAESINPAVGGRLGIEWYQVDRHVALGVEGGLRDMEGFARSRGSDVPLAWDASGALRYTF
jgi:hypothetical protein